MTLLINGSFEGNWYHKPNRPEWQIPRDWHLWVDGAVVGPVMTYTTSADLALGAHVITAELRLPDHTPLGPVAVVNVTVEPYNIMMPVVLKAYVGTAVLP